MNNNFYNYNKIKNQKKKMQILKFLNPNTNKN